MNLSRTTSREPFKVLIVGAGVAGLEAALTLEELAGGLVATTILAPEPDFLYRPMTVREPFALSRATRVPLAQLVDAAGAEQVRASLSWLAPTRRIAHTDQHEGLGYDAILLTQGARTLASFPYAITIDPWHLDEQLHGVVQDVELGAVASVAFVVPVGYSWPLPVYELALMTADRAYSMGQRPKITIVTSELRPLEIFGETASNAVSDALNAAEIEVLTDAAAHMPSHKRITIRGRETEIQADAVVALPELRGPNLPGVPATEIHGFVSTAPDGRVRGVEGVFAAGDITNYPIKHGSIAAWQAERAAYTLAELAGAHVVSEPREATLYGMLLAPGRTLYMRTRLEGGSAVSSEVSEAPLWDASAKIHAPRLTRALAQCTGSEPTMRSR